MRQGHPCKARAIDSRVGKPSELRGERKTQTAVHYCPVLIEAILAAGIQA
jgi:hypothetical protein